MDINPATGLVQPKRSWIYLHDGYMFGSGHYLPESEVKYVVEDAVRLYESRGQGAFGIITPEETLLTTKIYPFVFNSTTLKTVAHGAIPDRLGHVPYSILNTGDRPVEVIMADLERDGGAWVEYVFTNPATETKQLKRSWLYLHDGYVFSSGYYLQDSRAESFVDGAIMLYKASGQDAFNIITPEVTAPLSLQSVFVLDSTTLEVVAHSRLPHLIGTTSTHLGAADRSTERIMTDMFSETDTWVWYMAQNPATLTDQLTRTYLHLHDGYIFGSGYSLPDSRIQSLVDESIYTFKNDPVTAFGKITAGDLNMGDIYPYVRDATYIWAHGTLPQRVGPLPQPSISFATNERSTGTIMDAVAAGGGMIWTQYSFVSPYTNTDQIKRAWMTIHEDYLFGSSYNVPDADTRSVVDYAIFIYEFNKENDAWIDIITPEETVTNDDLYPFVFNSTTLETVAHGAIPDRLGHLPYAIIDTADRPIEHILADLEDDGSTWLTYTFYNPSTGTDQLKRTYMQLREGLIFGSGYYIQDSQVQAITYGQIIKYDQNGRDAAFKNINTVPEQPVSTYAFVADPNTGKTEAQNVDSSLIGPRSDWDVITSEMSVDQILNEIRGQNGAWVVYTFTNPVTGEAEEKRTWLMIHDGLVFGSGYYS